MNNVYLHNVFSNHWIQSKWERGVPNSSKMVAKVLREAMTAVFQSVAIWDKMLTLDKY